MGRTRASWSWRAGISWALLGCGASSDGPGSSSAPGDAPGATTGSGMDGASLPSGGSSAPSLSPGGLGNEPGSPTSPPIVSSLPGGFEPPDFSGFDPGLPSEASMACQQAERVFVPQIPTVFMLVDRSGSMFQENPPGSGRNAWGALRSGVLEVIEDLQSEVRFGFGAFSGQGATCPDMPSTALALDNHAPIASLYNSLERSDYKDTPTLLVINEVARQLWNDPTEGDKYILFVTDGEPDYCDDGNALCPPDSVVGRLQKLALGLDDAGAQNAPIRTFVFGIDSPLSTISPEVLQAFANAGVGQPVAPLVADPFGLYDQCNSVPGWSADFATTGKLRVRGATIGDYAALGGNATVYRPDPTDQAELVEQIRAALAGVKSCAFDLGGDGIQVDVSRPDLGVAARVLIDGAPLPFDAVNGWRMLSGTTVQLEGAACERWRVPGETSIEFDFPCDVIIVR